MYSLFSQISIFLSEPFSIAANTDIAIFAAMFLGFVGSLAPCQISANAAAITYFGNRYAQEKLSWQETGMYVLGKIAVFVLLGVVFWLFGQEVKKDFIPLFAFARKLLGPLLILIGLLLLGWIQLSLRFAFHWAEWMQTIAKKTGGNTGAFLLGSAFSLGFCPTMYVLFFGTLMPLSMETSYGLLLPPVFAAATAMPYLLLFGLAFVFGIDKVLIKRMKSWGLWIQRFTGFILVVLGIADTVTYWSL